MTSHYPLILALQLLIIHLDLVFNAIVPLIGDNHTTLLMIYMLQDTLIVIGIVVLAITFSSTFVFQAGLITLLLRKFSASIIFSVLYLLISTFFHYFSLNNRWQDTKTEVWPFWMQTLYVVHRCIALLYYMTYKRTSLLLSDPKYHEISEWLKTKIRQVGR